MKKLLSIKNSRSQTPVWERKVFNLIFFICCITITTFSFSQNRDINTLLDQTLRNRGLTREDISIPIEFFSAAEKNPTNESKLILPLVKDMMTNPLRSMTWLDSVSVWGNPETGSNFFNLLGLLDKLFAALGYFDMTEMKSIYEGEPMMNSFELLKYFTKQNYNSKSWLLKQLDENEKSFLSINLLSIFEETDKEPQANIDIFSYNKNRDSSIITSRKTVDIVDRLKKLNN